MTSWAKACRAFGLTITVVVALPSDASAQGRSATVATDKAAALAEAERLSAEVVRLYGEGKYAQTVPLAEQALLLREGTLGRKHPEVAAALHNLAVLYREQGAYAKAESLHLRALAIREKALGPGHPDVATSLHNLATLYQEQGIYAKAEPLYQCALDLFEKALGPEHPDVATSLNNLATLYQAQGAYAKAKPLHLRALAIREKMLGKEHPDVAQSLNNLAELYREQGAYAKAEPLLWSALAIRGEALGLDHSLFAQSLNNLAGLYQEQGAYAKAEPLFVHALAIKENALGPEHPSVGTSLNNLALLYQAQGVHAKAESLHLRALAVREKALGPDHPDVAQSLNNLAGLYQEQGIYAKAEPLYQRALTIREKAIGPEHPSTAISLNNLATLYQEQGAYAKAESLHVRALAIREKMLGQEHPSVATSLHNLATLYQARGELRRALALAMRAADLRERHLGAQLLNLPEPRKRLLLQKLSSAAEWATSFHAQSLPNDSEALQLALTTALRRKHRVFDELAGARSALHRNLSPTLQTDFDTLTAKQAELATLYDAARPEQVEAVRVLEAEVEWYEGELGHQSAAFRIPALPLMVERVQAALPHNATLVEFIRYHRFDATSSNPWKEAHYVAYTLRRDEPPRWVPLGEAISLETAEQAARRALTEHDGDGHLAADTDEARRALRALDALVLAPIRKVLGEVPHLLLSPDGALHTVPFEALVDEQGRYLVEHATVTYLGSGRDLLRMGAHPPPRSGPLVLAAPDYGSAAKPFEPLRGAAAEAAVVRRLFPEAQVLTDAAATREALLGAKGPRFALLATHGFLRHPGLPVQPASPPQTPTAQLSTFGERGTLLQRLPPDEGVDPERALERAGLALAGANARLDAVANGRDLAGLDLAGTQLVVLSACETGLGQLHDGEGVYSLRRALAIAGAASQVVSLWNVNDASTGELMGAYFKALRDGVGRSEALRQTQLGMLKQERYQHPYYWAAFIPAGDWRPLDGGNDVPRVPPGSACGCRLAGAEAGPSGAAFAALALLLVGGARRARPAQRPLR